ncbi:hypothetical protein [Streptomyces sp. NPDC089919]|uniref:hypothetical protein n=1 Tax=Streptomyces sp. NPDC089919 TaxID=3155188 RepID=UPI00343E93D0
MLSATAHAVMSGTGVPWWALAVAFCATAAGAWVLAGRERGPLGVVTAAVLVQSTLHTLFSAAQDAAATAAPAATGAVRAPLMAGHHHLAHPLPGTRPAPPSAHDLHSLHALVDGLGAAPAGPHPMAAMPGMDGMGGMAGGMTAGMLAGHLLAALLCGWWLAHGERGAFRVLRALAALLHVPLRLPGALGALPYLPRPRLRRARSARAPRLLLLSHALTTRGPPVGTAVV